MIAVLIEIGPALQFTLTIVGVIFGLAAAIKAGKR